MQAIKSIKLLIIAIAIWAIPLPVDSQNLPNSKLEASDNTQDPEVAEPSSTSETSPSKPTQSEETIPQSNSRYYIAPRIAPDERINPFTTTLPLNHTPISHLTNWEVLVNSTFGDNFEQDFGYSAILKIDSQVEESLSRENIFQTDQIGTYLQLQSVRNQREISTSLTVGQETLLGLELKMSLIGACLFGEGKPTDTCSYTPGLVIVLLFIMRVGARLEVFLKK